MARQIIAWEGEEKVPNKLLETGALEWDDRRYPVTMHYAPPSYEQDIVGYATDIRREEDGSITAEITWNDVWSTKSTTVAGQAQEAEYTRVDEFVTIHRFVLATIFISHEVPWGDYPDGYPVGNPAPRAFLKEENGN